MVAAYWFRSAKTGASASRGSAPVRASDVILSSGQALEVPMSELEGCDGGTSVEPVTLKDAERAHILRVLRDAEGVIATAAARLVCRVPLFSIKCDASASLFRENRQQPNRI
jgi:hypothetical protein